MIPSDKSNIENTELEKIELEEVGSISPTDFDFLIETYRSLSNLKEYLENIETERLSVAEHIDRVEYIIDAKLTQIRNSVGVSQETLCHIVGEKVYVEKAKIS